jgi:hypothetical protein
MYVGFDNNYPQGGMNDQGLFFDGLAVEPTIVPPDGDLPQFPGILLFHAMSTCADVQCVVDLFSQYDRSFMVGAQLFYGDASGDAVIIEPVEFIRKTDRYLVSTNFYQSATPPADITCERYQTAQAMLAEADTFTSDLFRDILDATHQTGDNPTQYSNIYDLTARTMTLYLFHDFEHPVEIDLAEELAQGAHAVDIISLFPENNTQAANWRDIRVRDYEAFMKRSGYYDPDVDTSGFAAYAGRYAVPQALIDAGITTAPYIELTFSDGWLAYDLPGDFSPPARLYPSSATSFMYVPFDARIVLFYSEVLIGVNGDIRGIQVLLGDTPVIFERLP